MSSFADFIDWASVGEATVVTKDPLGTYNITGPAAIVPFRMSDGRAATAMRLVLWDRRSADIQRIDTQPWEDRISGELRIGSIAVSMGKYGHGFTPEGIRPEQGPDIVRHMAETLLTDHPLDIEPAPLIAEIRLLLIACGDFHDLHEAKITTGMPPQAGDFSGAEIVTKPRLAGQTLRLVNQAIRRHAPTGCRTRLRDDRFTRLPIEIAIPLDKPTAHERMAAAGHKAARRRSVS